MGKAPAAPLINALHCLFLAISFQPTKPSSSGLYQSSFKLKGCEMHLQGYDEIHIGWLHSLCPAAMRDKHVCVSLKLKGFLK